MTRRKLPSGLVSAALALGLLLLAASPAAAATLYIGEYANGITPVGSSQPQVPPQPVITDQTVALSGASAVSAAFNTKTHVVSLICDEGCSVSFTGASPTATTSNILLQQGVTYNFGVAPGGKVAAIANAAGNSSGGGTVTIGAGSAIIGKVGIDQTTPGTTNGVQTLTGSTTAVTQATAANLNATVVQGNAGTNAQAWWVRIGDATNGPAAVKAASTAAVATDPGLVVSISPNGQLAAGQALMANSVPVVIASDQSPVKVVLQPTTAITASATGTTGATTATLAAAAAKTTYICGFTITSDATAALAGTATVTGTITGTMSYIQNVGGATAAGILTQTFAPCIPGSATNTGIAINSVAAGTGGNTAVTAWGYQQ